MPALSIATFFNGAATAWFAVNACQLLARRHRTRLQSLLAFIFVYWAVMTAKDLVSLMPGAYNGPMLDTIQMLDGLGVVVLTCLLFELSMPRWVTARRVALLLLPFALFLGAYMVWPSHWLATVYLAFLTVFGATALRLGFTRTTSYQKFLYGNFSDLDGIDLSWLKKVYFIVYLCMLIWVIMAMVRNPLVDSFSYVSTIVLWQAMLHYCSRMNDTRPRPDACGSPAPASADARDYPFAGRLEAVVERERLYLDPQLSIVQLAERLGTNRTYVSNYFNSALRTTFYDYINSLRIKKESVPMMENHPEYTLDYIAQCSGFNSVSTFRRAFRKHTGQNPGSWQGGQERRPGA